MSLLIGKKFVTGVLMGWESHVQVSGMCVVHYVTVCNCVNVYVAWFVTVYILCVIVCSVYVTWCVSVCSVC